MGPFHGIEDMEWNKNTKFAQPIGKVQQCGSQVSVTQYLAPKQELFHGYIIYNGTKFRPWILLSKNTFGLTLVDIQKENKTPLCELFPYGVLFRTGSSQPELFMWKWKWILMLSLKHFSGFMVLIVLRLTLSWNNCEY